MGFSFDSLRFTNAHVWQWPECIGVFAFGGSRHWEALVLAAIGGPVPVAARIWVLAFAQRHRDRAGRTARALARAAYAAFILQGLPLIVSAWRP